MVHGLCLGGSRGTKICVFRLKWLQPAMKGTSSVQRVRLGSCHARIVPPMRFPSSGCSCVRSSMRFLKLWLQIALEWLHECCMGFLGQEAAARHLVFPCKVTAAGEERCLVCVAAGFLYLFLLRLLQRVVVPVCVVLCGS